MCLPSSAAKPTHMYEGVGIGFAIVRKAAAARGRMQSSKRGSD